MPDNAPTPLKPRLAISIDQAQAASEGTEQIASQGAFIVIGATERGGGSAAEIWRDIRDSFAGKIALGLRGELPDAELFAIYAGMGASLREINDITLDSFGYIGPNGVWTPHATNRNYMSSQFERKLMEFCERGGDPALAERLRVSIAARRHLLHGAVVPRLCHYDLHAGNVLVTASRAPLLSGIVDFENATAGDPLMDVAKALYYFTPLEKPQDALKRSGLLAGYGVIERPNWQDTSTSTGSAARWSYGAGRRSSACTTGLPNSPGSWRASIGASPSMPKPSKNVASVAIERKKVRPRIGPVAQPPGSP